MSATTLKSQFPYIRIFLAVTLLLLEVILLSLVFTAISLPENGILSIIIAKSGYFLRWMIVASGCLIVILSYNSSFNIDTLLTKYTKLRTFIATTVHLCIFIGFVITANRVLIYQHDQSNNYNFTWLLLVVLTAISWCLIIADKERWMKFLSEQFTSIVIALTCGFIIIVLGYYFQNFWEPMTEFTLGAAKFVLEIFYKDIIIDVSQKQLGIDKFYVLIGSPCSGLEGVVLAVSITGLYLYFSRNHLRVPQALILLPLAGIMSIALNIFRIVALIIIGEEVSPALAIGGFHSVAGWLSAILVALLIVFVFSQWNWIQKNTKVDRGHLVVSSDSKLAQAILIPFVVYTTLALLSQGFIEGFDYFYPIKVIFSLAIVFYFWKLYQIKVSDSKLISILAGVVVAILWVVIVPTDEEININTIESFSSMSIWLQIGWGFIRLVGFLILIPILEELVFRGYLLSRLSGQNINNNGKLDFNLFALILSSVLFGLLHDAWLAGTVAGFAFAFVRYQSESIINSITAHSVANLLVFCVAAYTGNWSLL